MSRSKDWLARRASVVSRGLPRVTEITSVSASGSTIVDAEGREFIDFAGGIGVMNVGHCDPKVVAAIQAQADERARVVVVSNDRNLRLKARAVGLEAADPSGHWPH